MGSVLDLSNVMDFFIIPKRNKVWKGLEYSMIAHSAQRDGQDANSHLSHSQAVYHMVTTVHFNGSCSMERRGGLEQALYKHYLFEFPTLLCRAYHPHPLSEVIVCLGRSVPLATLHPLCMTSELVLSADFL